MLISLGRIVRDDLTADGSRFADGSRPTSRYNYKDHSKTFDEDFNNLWNNTMRTGSITQLDGIIHPFPWIKRPWDTDSGSTQTVSWPSIQKIIEKSPDIKVDMIENDQAYLVIADIPGYSEDEIKLYLSDDNELKISAERVNEITADSGEYTINERSRGKIERSITIDGAIDIDNIKADFKDGVLKVILPKDASERNRYIPINKS